MWQKIFWPFVLFAAVIGLCGAVQAGDYGRITIHRKSYLLEFVRNDSIILTVPIRVGKKNFPTPLGDGYIGEKRTHPIFRFVDPGPKQGKIVDSAECAAGKMRVDYRKMRALMLHYDSLVLPQRIIQRRHLDVDGEERFSIHSVTCSETIGQAISKGCIGISIPDMLKLFELIQADHAGIEATRFRVLDD